MPRYRKKFLVGKIRSRLLELIYEYAERFPVKILAVEIMPDHVHLFLRVKPNISPSQFALYLKGWTSSTLRAEFPWLKGRRAFWSPS